MGFSVQRQRSRERLAGTRRVRRSSGVFVLVQRKEYSRAEVIVETPVQSMTLETSHGASQENVYVRHD